MSFSRIAPAPAPLAYRSAGARHEQSLDALVEAWEATRELRQVEFTWDRKAAWIEAIRALARQIERSVTLHLNAVDDPRHSGASVGEPPTPCRRDEHLRLGTCVRELIGRCAVTDVVSIWTVVDVGERAVEVEMAIARHHNRIAAFSAAAHRPPVALAHAALSGSER